MKEENKDKRLLQVELDNNVKEVSITGLDAENKVIMKQDLNEDEIDQISAGIYPYPIRDRCYRKRK
jgi:hypothetical protein